MTTTTELMNVLEDTASLLQKTQVNLKKCPKSRLTKGYIETRIKAIEEYWTTFKRSHHDLIKIISKEQKAILPYFVNEEFYIYEDLYFVLLGDLRDMMNAFTTSPATTSEHNVSSESNPDKQNALVRLPRIQLPSFSGKYNEWPTFQDLFTSLVHTNTTISDVQKLHYLKCSVTGEAETLLKHIQVTQQNYDKAWNTLKSRYGNKRSIVNSVLKQLFNQKKMNTQTPSLIKNLLDTTSECLDNLNNLKISTDSWDPLIIFLIVQKLDPESHKDWEKFTYKDNLDELPTWTDMKKFLQSTFRTLEVVMPGTRDKPTRESSFHISSASPSSEKKCILCKSNHTLCHCKEFTKLQPNERLDYAKTNKLCFNCLVPGHSAVNCRLPMSCRICKRRHHSLLHQNKESDSSAQKNSTPPQTAHHCVEDQEEVHVNTMVASNHKSISTRQSIALLATAAVTVSNEHNQTVVLRALVDQGSQTALISEKAAQMLNLTKQSARGSIIGVGSTRTNVNHVVQLQIGSRWNTNFKIDVEAYVMSKQLTTKLPPKTVTAGNWPHLEGLNLADSNYDTPGPIDLLLGVKEYSQIVQEQLIKGPPGTPCAQKTYLGWILFGNVDMKSQDESIHVLLHQVDMDIMLKSLWEIDTENNRKLSKEERLCESIYEETYKRTEEGRYMVKLPLKTPNPQCLEGNTKEIAKNRLLQLERKFRRLPKLKENYKKVMREYLTLNYMQEIPANEVMKEKVVYLPHHAVIREDKETSKTRVVFDASAKGSNQYSLNDELLVGPLLQEDLRNIIMRWRMKRVCYASDIKQMYLQIYVYPEDANTYQRILWRENEHDSIKEFRLLRVTFGTASAPYLAIKTLHQVADDEGQSHPKAVRIIKENFLVDDLLGGEDTTNQAITSAKNVSHILKRAGFTLSKWSSNCSEFMKSIDVKDRSSTAYLNINNMDGTVKALGLVWNLSTDQFQYQMRLPTTSVIVTKRSVLSDVQKLFDPLGWIAPSLVMAKMFIQRLWLERLDWDDRLNLQLQEEWMVVRNDLQNVNNIFIDRWLGTLSTQIKTVQIHGFSDASMKAYAAVAYVRTETAEGHVATKLIAARTRLAPLKTVSLPRLELSGALLLSRLLNQIGKAMRISTSQIFAWTDSTIVIAWLSGEPHRWKSFVANRVVEIIENLNDNRWYHVASEDNPADIASRGMLLADLKQSELWWKGPVWLSERKLVLKQPDVTATDLEKKKDKLQINTKIQNEEKNGSFTAHFQQFDNLHELLKVITYCRRFLNYKKCNTYANSFTTDELHTSLLKCIKLVQSEEFRDDIERLKSNKNLSKNSNIKALTPYLDQDGILRVGGRLRHANLDEENKHPIILGHNNDLIPLIIADAHAQTLHGGVQLTLCFLRSKYWIIRAKGLVKRFNRKCLVCAKQRANARTQMMGDLPRERVTPTRAFLHSGVDFAGPFQILMSRGRGAKTHKAYIALFICMSTRAIHLELVGDLTSEAFIAAFKRFISRRGKCSHLWSDQGRNFVGAQKELATAWQEANLNFESCIANKLALEGTQWHFIPAYSPNFGGLWEAGVKSLKHHLKRVLTTSLTFEEMTTVLCQVEACLNSRPLCPIDDSDIDSIEPLTPGHFLIHEAPIVVPSPDLKDIKIHTLSRWQYTQKLLGDIWRRWQIEYLSSLQQRPIWLKKTEEFQIGDIVLIKTEGLPPGKWLLGRIVDKHPGNDGLTRVYSVKSGSSIVKRSITKLCPLPVDTEI